MQRLQKVLSEGGIASRRKSEAIILEGRVKVNGEVVKTLGFKVSDKDEIMVDGSLVSRDEKLYFLLYKPEKVVCTVSDDKGRRTVIDMLDYRQKLFPVGRLDYDTSGALILTNDGELANILMHPSKHVEKVYTVKVDGIMKKDEIILMQKGIVIDGIKTKRCRASIKKIDIKNKKTYLEITLTEGRNHQVKNMISYFGYKVAKLKRTRYAFLTLDGPKKGEARSLSIKEVKQLYNEKNV